jgi:hypothetical protein
MSNAYKLIQKFTHVYLTAAHCVNLRKEILREDFVIYLGMYKLRDVNEEGSQYHDVSNFNIICQFPYDIYSKFYTLVPKIFLFIFWTLYASQCNLYIYILVVLMH